MRPLVLSSILLSAAFLVGCGADNIQAPSPSARTSLLERGAGRSEAAFDFTAIDVPNAVFTSATGINPRGDIVGTYVDASQRSHGYVLRDGAFTTIDFPGAAGTDARGIGPSGEIVGNYWFAGEPAVNIHGYLLTKRGEFVAVNYPGHTNTIAQRILPDGTILGCRHDNDTMGSMKGVVITRSGSEEIDQFASMINGATPDHRRIVGLYANTAGSQQGFLIDDGVFTPLLVGNIPTTAAWDMNPVGEIVGVYRNSAGFHGFVLRADGYTSIDVPGAAATRAFGINPHGNVVGTYAAGGVTHGFLATR
jgi:uncharacterized membrane protein